ASVSQATESEATDESTATPFRHIGEVLPGWLRERMDAVGYNSSPADESAAGDEASGADAGDEDRDAEIRDRGPRAEFAQRRGGRGRRRRHQGPPPPSAAAAAGDETNEGEADAESPEPAIEEAP